jgi:hypothetical protein
VKKLALIILSIAGIWLLINFLWTLLQLAMT